MTAREQTKDYIKVMQHYADGGKIEYKHITSKDWMPFPENDTPYWNWRGFEYRIKREPRLRPYANAEEFLRAQKEHGPYIKLVNRDAYYIPTIIGSFLFQKEKFFMIGRQPTTPLELLKYFKFQDGTPCGIEE